MGAVLSIDYGTKRVGLAASDATRAYVFPRDTMLRSTPTEEAAYLRALCREDGIDLLAVGLPLNADGTEGPMAMAARKYAADLTSALQVPHVLVDERYTSQESGYAQIQGTKPKTVGYALHDSPVGQLAWIAEKFRTWTDCDGVIENAVTRDELLTNIMLYWVTGTAPSAGRIYRESRVFGDPTLLGQRLETPVGFAAFPKEVILSPRSWLEAVYNIVQYTEMPRGGHFAALEQPELLVDDIRAFFRRFRE